MAMNYFTVHYALDLYNKKQNLQNGMKGATRVDFHASGACVTCE